MPKSRQAGDRAKGVGKISMGGAQSLIYETILAEWLTGWGGGKGTGLLISDADVIFWWPPVKYNPLVVLNQNVFTFSNVTNRFEKNLGLGACNRHTLPELQNINTSWILEGWAGPRAKPLCRSVF